ncbi:MAG: pantoate--beta-alanine ligase [Mariprofundus sp.]|nr:pantoate--beta-alanine ligase [Mariprofundus sp.]
MRISRTTKEIRQQLKALRGHQTIALVATMGCLHAGHLSLIKKAREIADIVVVTIYVNPLQFGPNEDLDSYPRPFDQDAKLCADADVDFIFNPTNLYHDQRPKITLHASELPDCLCGKARPGHFDGVITVVNILFNIIQPTIALFGEKDWQQLTIIRRMVRDLQMDIEVLGAETIREHSGLALSSRNSYLTDDTQQQARVLSQALILMQELALGGESACHKLIHAGMAILKSAAIQPEYLEIRDATSLAPVTTLTNQTARIFIAAKVGNARLIDNMPLSPTILNSETQP